MKFSRKPWKFVALFGVVGAVAAIGMGAASFYSSDQSSASFIDALTLMLFPACVIARSIQSGAEYGQYALSVAANALLYMLLGGFVWLGIRRHRAFLVVPVLSLALIWWQMFALYGNLLVAYSDVPMY